MSSRFDGNLVAEFRDFIAQRFGLEFDESKSDFLAAVIRRRSAASTPHEERQYLNDLIHRAPASEMAALADELTVSESYFFRHSDQFRALSQIIENWRFDSGRGCRPISALSAGCSSGEEAYSLAIVMREKYAPGEATVTGIDVNPQVLAKAAEATYSPWSLRGVPEEIRERHFRGERSFVIDETVRSRVAFQPLNLLESDESFWLEERFDVIFFRNVAMYFTPDATRAVVARLTRSLRRGGFLFLGPAETLRGISQDFHLFHTHDTFYYQRRQKNERPISKVVPGAGHSPSASLAPPGMIVTDDSWLAAINRASERIALLSRGVPSSGRRDDRPTPVPMPLESHAAPAKGRESANVAHVRELIAQERFEEALSALCAFTAEQTQSSPDAPLLRALVLTNTGQVEEAKALCQQVLDSDELNAEAHFLLALCREHEGNIDAAVEHDERATYLDPAFAMPHLHLGLLHRRRGDGQSAKRSFRQARALLPREDSTRILLLGGGFDRETLCNLCEVELTNLGDSR